MERLEPVLKQKFWILLGLGIIMTLTGWWMATKAMASQTAERMGKIKAAEESVPKGEVANEAWTKRLAALNGVQEASNGVTKMGLYKKQLARMTIPVELDQKVAFMGKFSNDDREIFRDIYSNEVQRVWKMLNPLDIDGSGVVNFPLRDMYKLMNQKGWPTAAPKSETIWEILEDFWLLEGLFQSLADVNGGPLATRMEAVVHQIDKIELRGGGDPLPTGGTAGGMGVEGTIAGMMGASSMMGGASSMMGGASSSGGASSMTTVSADFDVREEFGDDGAGAGGGGGRQAMMSSMSSMAMMGASGNADMGMGALGAATETVIKRYVSDDASKPFKTRGFYLSVKMDHRRIPQLIAELTANDKSVWPVEILRVQMSRIHEDELSPGGGGGGGMGGGGYMANMRAQMAKAAAADQAATASMLTTMSSPMMPSMGSSGGSADDFSAFLGPNYSAAGNGPKSQKLIEAEEMLENVMKDPYMAQVTLCGVFYMYRKVEEPAKVETTAPVGTDGSATADPNAAATGDAAALGDAGGPATADGGDAASNADPFSTPTDATGADPLLGDEQPTAATASEAEMPADTGDDAAENPDGLPAKTEEENPKSDDEL